MKGIFSYIKRDLSAFLALFLIVTAGTAAFTAPRLWADSVRQAGTDFFAARNAADAEVSSSLYFKQEDVDSIRRFPGVGGAEGFFRMPAVLETSTVVRAVELVSLTETLETAELISGRLPAAADECAVGSAVAELAGVGIGQTVLVGPREEDAAPLQTDTLKIVGVVRHPDFLKQTDADFVLVSPALLGSDPDGGPYSHLWVRMDKDREALLFTASYGEAREKLEEALAGYSASFTSNRIRSLENEYLKEESSSLGVIEQQLQQLSRKETEIAEKKAVLETLVQGLKDRAEDARTALEDARAEWESEKAGFDGIGKDLEDARSRVEQLQSIDNIVRGELAQAEALLNTSLLKNVLPTFRQCAEGVLSAFLKADLTHPSEMETAVEKAMNQWDTAWDGFRSGLSEDDVRTIEHSTGRSLVSIGLQISNQLRDYGGTLQLAGSQNPGLQEEIRTVVNERGSGALSNAILARITQLRNEIAEMEQSYQEKALLLSEKETALQDKQTEYETAQQKLDDAELESRTQLNGEEMSLIASRLMLEAEKEETEKQLAEKKALLEEKKSAVWTQAAPRSGSMLEDLAVNVRLADKTALWSGVLAALLIVSFLYCLISRQIRDSAAEAAHPLIRRRGMTDFSLKTAAAALVFLLPSAAAGTLLGRQIAARLTEGSLETYSLTAAPAAAFAETVRLPLAVTLLLLVLGALLALAAASGKNAALLHAPALFLLAAGSCFVFGAVLWLGWGLFRRRTELGEVLPVFLKSAPGVLILLTLCVLLFACILLPALERFRADQSRELLYLMRAAGTGAETCAAYLGRRALLPVLAGVLGGGAAGLFAAGRLQALLSAAESGFQSMPAWLAFGLAAAGSLILLAWLPSGVRRRAGREALTLY